MEEKMAIDKTVEEKIEASFKKVFYDKYVMDWDTEKHNLERIERYGITDKTTSITLYDIDVQYVNKQGEIKTVKTDTMTFTLCHKGEPCTTLRDSIRPKSDYEIVMEYINDGETYRYAFVLKYLEYLRKALYDNCAFFNPIYLIDTRDKTKSVRLDYKKQEVDRGYLNIFMWIILKNNVFDTPEREREKKVLAPPSDVAEANRKFTEALFGTINNATNASGFLNANRSTMQINTYSPKSSKTGSSDPYEELENLIGLESIKKQIKELTSFVKMQQRRKKQGLEPVPVSLHMVFTGNPGTGKTTIARILGEIYKDIGVLSKGHFVEVDRSGLVAGYVGQTAMKTSEVINRAKGGILFIDEAYSLVSSDDKDFGHEAIDTLLKAMEDNREDFIVIVAGYPELMQGFINSNPGLQSRFNRYIHFPDYNADELLEVFKGFCDKYEYKLDEDVEPKMKDFLQKLVDEKTVNFANARTVRNIFENVVTKQSTRLDNDENEDADIQQLTIEDFKDIW